MASRVMFLDCPEYKDDHGAVRCGLPAEVLDRYIAESSSGPLESVRIRCPLGHWYNCPVEFLYLQHLGQPRPLAGPLLDERSGVNSHRGGRAG